MARCEKCLYDPCLCHLGGFGQDEDESTSKKEINDLVGRKCIVKISDKGTNLFLKGIRDFKPDQRRTDITGIIETFQIIAVPGINAETDLIDLGLGDTEGVLPPGVEPMPIFYVRYDNLKYDEIPGHWYIDEEVIYI